MSAFCAYSFRVNLAFQHAAEAVYLARCYGEASREASRATGRERCRWAGIASGYARAARRSAALHNAALALLSVAGG